jgi:formylmethanofuran dehydrogenase subunit E
LWNLKEIPHTANFNRVPDKVYPEVKMADRVFREKPLKRVDGGGLKDRPLCERCGRPVRISREDYLRGEILCPTCAAEGRTPEMDEFDLGSRYA